jgi:WD40 repeat protein
VTRRSKKLLTRALAAKALLALAGLLRSPRSVVEPPTLPQTPIHETIKIVQSKPKHYRQLGSEKDQIRSLAWSPNGRWIAVGLSGGRVRIWSPSGRVVADLNAAQDYLNVAWRPDSRVLAVAGQVDIRFYSTATWRESRSLPRIGARPLCLAWSPDGRWLAEDSGRNRIRIWKVATGRLARRIRYRSFAQVPDPAEGCIMAEGRAALAWRPGSRQLAYVGSDDRFRVWDASTGWLLRRRRAADCETSGVDWSPDGKRLVVGSLGGAVSIWDVAAGRRLRQLRGESENGDGLLVNAVAWCPTRPWIAIAGDEYPRGCPIRVFDARTGKRFRSLWGHEWDVDAITWSPNGRILASAGHDSGVRLWEVAKSPWP